MTNKEVEDGIKEVEYDWINEDDNDDPDKDGNNYIDEDEGYIREKKGNRSMDIEVLSNDVIYDYIDCLEKYVIK